MPLPGPYWLAYIPIDTMRTMTDGHRSMRIARTLWERYGTVVGDLGRTADLKVFLDWAAENPGVQLADDAAGPHDFTPTFRIEGPRWQAFLESIGDADYSSVLRRYINWRTAHPNQPLPGRRVPPLKRQRRPLACV
jgi:hypothetical protein